MEEAKTIGKFSFTQCLISLAHIAKNHIICNEAKAMWKIICFDRILKQWSSFQTISWENNKCLAGEMEQ